jgi:hypothetical protein
MLKVKLDYVENEWSGEFRNELIVEHNGKVIEEHWDGGEPEDNTFSRDWSWVAGAIERAYKLGLEDGLDLTLRVVRPRQGGTNDITGRIKT